MSQIPPFDFRSPRRLTLSVLAATLGLAACNDNSTTGPSASRSCGTAGVVQLAPLQSVTLDCSSSTTVQLAGGASYLVVPQFATGNVANQPVPFSHGVNGAPGATVSASKARLPSGASTSIVRPSAVAAPHNARQLSFDRALR